MNYEKWKSQANTLKDKFSDMIKEHNAWHKLAQDEHDRDKNSNRFKRTDDWWDEEIEKQHRAINGKVIEKAKEERLEVEALGLAIKEETKNVKRPLAKEDITASELQANRAYQFLSSPVNPVAITNQLNKALENGDIDFYTAMYENLEAKLSHDITSPVWQDVQTINERFEQDSGLAELNDITSSLDEVDKASKLIDSAIEENYFPIFTESMIESMTEKEAVTNYDGMIKSLELMG